MDKEDMIEDLKKFKNAFGSYGDEIDEKLAILKRCSGLEGDN